MSAKETMFDIAEKAMSGSFFSVYPYCPKRFPKPGDAWFRLKEDVREELRQLKSDDIKDVRVDDRIGLFLLNK
jgi:hypothetical protein